MSSSSKNLKKHHHGGGGGGGAVTPSPQKPPLSSSSIDQQKKQQKSPFNSSAVTNNNPTSDPSFPSPNAPMPRPPILPPLDVPPPPPAYGFHMLDRRTIVLADGSVRSYFALPPDYTFPPRPELGGDALGFDSRQHFPHPHIPPHFVPPSSGGGHFSPGSFRDSLPIGRGGGDYWSSLGLDGPNSLKRKHAEDEDYVRQFGQHVGPPQYGNPGIDYMLRPPGSPLYRDRLDEDGRLPKNARLGGAFPSQEDPLLGRSEVTPAALGVDRQALKRAFLRFSKSINESASQRNNYLQDGKHGRISCLACGRASKEFIDVHGLIMHAYTSQTASLRVDHLGLHKALCVLMGWNYTKAPDDSKMYQSLSPKEAAINREDLIMWPPNVIIHNTLTARRKDGRLEGIGNKEMDNKLKELGFSGGKSKAMYGKEGHLGITIVKFANSQTGLEEAEHLADFFEKDGHGRRGWDLAEAFQSGASDDRNPALFTVDEKTGEKKRILYGYLATAFDLDKVEFDIRKKTVIKSKREFDPSD